MVLSEFYKKHENKIIAVGFISIFFIWTSIRYDFYFSLNDDVVMKDILSGVYTGEPESRNIQMMYPMSLMISLLYRIFPHVPVYGIFLLGCHCICFFLIVERSISFCRNTMTKLLSAAVAGLIVTSLYLSHFVFIHYTIIAALMAGTAIFLFITSEPEQLMKKFLIKNLWSIILVSAAFCMRSEMLLLALPLICVAGVYKWSKESHIFAQYNIMKYFAVIGSILISLIMIYIINDVAYGSRSWKTFINFFNSRTELYDFQKIPDYEGNEALYQRLGLTRAEQDMLFAQYDFGMDDTLDAGILDAMAKHQAETKKQCESIAERVIGVLKEYYYTMIDNYPWNLMVVLGYFFVFVFGMGNEIRLLKENEKQQRNRMVTGVWKIGWKLIFLGVVRTLLWMFILIRGRAPERITHSLYLIELCTLWAMYYVETVGISLKINQKAKMTIVLPLVFAIMAAFSLHSAVTAVDKKFVKQEEVDETNRKMKEFYLAHQENFYFVDVYSWVSFSEKVFENVNNQLGNYDIMGGWLNKSPLYDKKLKAFGLSSMQEALAYDENVYMMAELEKGTDFLTDYYADQGVETEVRLVDTINGIIGVYEIQGYITEEIVE